MITGRIDRRSRILFAAAADQGKAIWAGASSCHFNLFGCAPRNGVHALFAPVHRR